MWHYEKFISVWVIVFGENSLLWATCRSTKCNLISEVLKTTSRFRHRIQLLLLAMLLDMKEDSKKLFKIKKRDSTQPGFLKKKLKSFKKQYWKVENVELYLGKLNGSSRFCSFQEAYRNLNSASPRDILSRVDRNFITLFTTFQTSLHLHTLPRNKREPNI